MQKVLDLPFASPTMMEPFQTQTGSRQNCGASALDWSCSPVKAQPVV